MGLLRALSQRLGFAELPRAVLQVGARSAGDLPDIVEHGNMLYPRRPNGDHSFFDGYMARLRSPAAHQIEGVTLNESLRGKGIGKAMYERAAQDAMTARVPLISDETVSADARKMWDYLASRGYRVIRNELVDPPKGKPYKTSLGGRRGPAFVLDPMTETRWGIPLTADEVLRKYGVDPYAGTAMEVFVNHPRKIAAAGAGGLMGALAFPRGDE